MQKSSPFIRPIMPPPAGGAPLDFVLLTVLVSIIVGSAAFLPLFSLEGLLIVAGGTVAVAFMSFQIEGCCARPSMPSKPCLVNRAGADNLHYDMMKIVAWGSVLREKGKRSLEISLKKSGIDDPFVKYGLNMVVSDYTPEEVRTMMETAADACFERDSAPVDVLHAMASHAPAFGMVGTLVGMVTFAVPVSTAT